MCVTSSYKKLHLESHTVHVWYIFLHLVDFYCKCRSTDLYFCRSTLQNKAQTSIKTRGPIWVLGIYTIHECYGNGMASFHHTKMSLWKSLIAHFALGLPYQWKVRGSFSWLKLCVLHVCLIFLKNPSNICIICIIYIYPVSFQAMGYRKGWQDKRASSIPTVVVIRM